MANTPRNNGKPWTAEADKALKKLADGNTPTRLIALKLERTEAAIYDHASRLGLPLKPVNQSPYGLKGK